MATCDLSRVGEHGCFPLLDSIAPYRDTKVHLDLPIVALRSRGLQENILLTAIWFTQNILGSSPRYLLKGSCVWFLYC